MSFNYLNKKGFTLMELIVTVILVAVLASYGVYYYTNTIREGEVKAAKGKLAALGGGVARFILEYGQPGLSAPLLIDTTIESGTCNYYSHNASEKMKSIFTCGYIEKSLGFDEKFNFYFGIPSNSACGGNLDTLSVFMKPKEQNVEGYPSCAFFNPNTDTVVEVQN